jgi:thioesterase domain-containing protein
MITCRAPKTKKEFEQYYHLRWLVLRSPWGKEKGSEIDELEEQAIHRCIFDQHGSVLAVGRLHFTDQHHTQIRYMAVDDNVQGQGYGNILLESLELEAQKRGAISIELNAREVALGFYQKLGYQNLGLAHLLYEKIQHYSMKKNINPLPIHLEENAKKLEEIWHNTIPLSEAMKVNICHFDGVEFVTNCDPAFNKNLHNTMFAGSIYTLATLTGWGWVYLQLQKNNSQGDIVLADANIKYLAPITGVAFAKTEQQFVEGCTTVLEREGKARIRITVNIYNGEKIAATFIGKYVVIKKEEH